MPRLILLPGLDGTGRLFDDLVAALPSAIHTRVIAYPTDLPLGYTELERLLEDSLSGDDQACFVLGESFSGPLAVRLARNPRLEIQGVILCTSFVRNPITWLPIPAAWIPALSPERLPPGLINHFTLGRFSSAELLEKLTDALYQVKGEVLQIRIRNIFREDLSEALVHVRQPLLYLGANQDRLVKPQAWHLIKAKKTDAESQWFDAPHLLLQTRPQEAADAVTAFIEKVLTQEIPG